MPGPQGRAAERAEDDERRPAVVEAEAGHAAVGRRTAVEPDAMERGRQLAAATRQQQADAGRPRGLRGTTGPPPQRGRVGLAAGRRPHPGIVRARPSSTTNGPGPSISVKRGANGLIEGRIAFGGRHDRPRHGLPAPGQGEIEELDARRGQDLEAIAAGRPGGALDAVDDRRAEQERPARRPGLQGHGRQPGPGVVAAPSPRRDSRGEGRRAGRSGRAPARPGPHRGPGRAGARRPATARSSRRSSARRARSPRPSGPSPTSARPPGRWRARPTRSWGRTAVAARGQVMGTLAGAAAAAGLRRGRGLAGPRRRRRRARGRRRAGRAGVRLAGRPTA